MIVTLPDILSRSPAPPRRVNRGGVCALRTRTRRRRKMPHPLLDKMSRSPGAAASSNRTGKRPGHRIGCGMTRPRRPVIMPPRPTGNPPPIAAGTLPVVGPLLIAAPAPRPGGKSPARIALPGLFLLAGHGLRGNLFPRPDRPPGRRRALVDKMSRSPGRLSKRHPQPLIPMIRRKMKNEKIS